MLEAEKLEMDRILSPLQAHRRTTLTKTPPQPPLPSFTHSPGHGCIRTLAARMTPAVRETAGTSRCVCRCVCVCGRVRLTVRIQSERGWVGACVCVHGCVSSQASSCLNIHVVCVCPRKRERESELYLAEFLFFFGLSYLPFALPLPLPGRRGFVRRRFVQGTARLAGCPGGTGRACAEGGKKKLIAVGPVTPPLTVTSIEPQMTRNKSKFANTSLVVINLRATNHTPRGFLLHILPWPSGRETSQELCMRVRVCACM